MDIALLRAILEPGSEITKDFTTDINLVFTIRYRVSQKTFPIEALRYAFRVPRSLPEDGKTLLTLGLNGCLGL